MTLTDEKQALRTAMRARLHALPAMTRRLHSENACAHLVAAQAFRDAKVLLFYRAMPQECDPALAAQAAQKAGKRIAFPLCLAGNRLALYEPLSEDAFAEGKYGIWEPVPERCRQIMPDEIDLAIIPGVAFGRDGSRLGQGAGYYDRLLGEVRGVKVGFAFGFQVLASVPSGELDVKMDMIAENNGIIVNNTHSSL